MHACCCLIYPSFAGWKSVAATLLNSNMLHPLDRLSVHHPLTHKVHFLSLQQRVWYMTWAHLPPCWGWWVLFSFTKINGCYTHGCHQNNKKKKKKPQTQTTRGQLKYNTKSTSCCLLKIGLRRRHTQTTQIEPGLLSPHHMTEHLKTEEALSNSTFPKLQSTI